MPRGIALSMSDERSLRCGCARDLEGSVSDEGCARCNHPHRQDGDHCYWCCDRLHFREYAHTCPGAHYWQRKESVKAAEVDQTSEIG